MNAEELREKFSERVPMLDAFGEWVTARVIREVKSRLGSKYSDYFFKVPPKHRVKDVDGFIEKAYRKNKNYQNPLVDITDQVGTRFVVLLFNQCNIVNEAVTSIPEYTCDAAKDVIVIRNEDPHHFDYESYHWTVHLNQPLQIGGILIPNDVACEIQVRTLLQHAYAELAHSTVYKPKTSAKPEVKRVIARGAALIETTDKVFLDVAREIQIASERLDGVLSKCAEWYEDAIEPGPYSTDGLAERITDAYVDEITDSTWSEIVEFIKIRPWLKESISELKNAGKPLFDNPVAILIFWLVHKMRHEVGDQWPLEKSFLVPFFTRLGISPDSSLD